MHTSYQCVIHIYHVLVQVIRGHLHLRRRESRTGRRIASTEHAVEDDTLNTANIVEQAVLPRSARAATVSRLHVNELIHSPIGPAVVYRASHSAALSAPASTRHLSRGIAASEKDDMPPIRIYSY